MKNKTAQKILNKIDGGDKTRPVSEADIRSIIPEEVNSNVNVSGVEVDVAVWDMDPDAVNRGTGLGQLDGFARQQPSFLNIVHDVEVYKKRIREVPPEITATCSGNGLFPCSLWRSCPVFSKEFYEGTQNTVPLRLWQQLAGPLKDWRPISRRGSLAWAIRAQICARLSAMKRPMVLPKTLFQSFSTRSKKGPLIRRSNLYQSLQLLYVDPADVDGLSTHYVEA